MSARAKIRDLMSNFATCECNFTEDIYHKDQGMSKDEFLEYYEAHAIDPRDPRFFNEYVEIRNDKSLLPVPIPNYHALGCYDLDRYPEILCTDYQRVSIYGNRYINANYVHSYYHKNAFILTQGPLEETVDSFWQMIWEQRTVTIVCLTQMQEQKKPPEKPGDKPEMAEKCYQYWPVNMKTGQQTKNFVIRNRYTFQKGEYCNVCTLELSRKDLPGESREVYHCLYTGWPDFGVPKQPSEFKNYSAAVFSCQKLGLSRQPKLWENRCPQGPPVVVHCSAGIGRSGTFVAFEILRLKLSDTGKIDIKDTVYVLRKQRNQAVQKPDQYSFLYAGMADYITREKNPKKWRKDNQKKNKKKTTRTNAASPGPDDRGSNDLTNDRNKAGTGSGRLDLGNKTPSPPIAQPGSTSVHKPCDKKPQVELLQAHKIFPEPAPAPVSRWNPFNLFRPKSNSAPEGDRSGSTSNRLAVGQQLKTIKPATFSSTTKD